MKNESNQFPKEEKKSRYKHDFKVKEGCLSFSFFGYTKYFFGTEFFNWLKENNLEKYFEYVSYESYGEVIMVYMNETVKSMDKKTKEIRILKHFPYGLTPYIKGAKPKIDNPIKHIKEEYLRRDEEKREYEENIMKEIEQDNIRHGYVPEETELNENSVFKKGVLALMAFFLSMGIQKTYAQCSADLQAAMKNPNDPKNAKILSGAGTDLDLKINIENGFGGKYQMMSKEDRIEYQKQLAKEKRDDELYKKALSKEFKRKFDPDLDLQGDKLPKPEIKKFQQNFKDFLVRNPQFKIDPSRYSVEERYAFLTKVVQEQSLIRRLNVLFGRPNPFDNVKMTVDELYKLIQDTKINGFDNFTEKYREGFPGVPFPDNPHKFEKNILGYEDFDSEKINESDNFKKLVIGLMSFFLSMGIQKTYAQCSAQLQAAMKNPNDPKNAKLIKGSQDEIDKKVAHYNNPRSTGPSYGSFNSLNGPSSDDAIMRRAERQEKRADNAWKHAKQVYFDNLFKPNLDLQGDKLDKEQKQAFKDRFNAFIVRNPQFKIDPSRYSVEERYAFLTKVAMEQSTVRRLNVLFGKPNPYENVRLSIDELYKLIQDPKINGFDNFTEMYRQDFPGISFPDNPHKFENTILDYNDFLNENWLKKAALAGALTAGALSGQSQQKINKFADFQKNVDKVIDNKDHIKINHTFNSPDDINKWLKSNLDTNTTWEISKMEVIGDTKLHIKFNADKSKDGFNRIVFTCNKQTLKEEDKSVTKVLAKNPGSELLFSGSYFTLNGIDYDWYLIGINTGTTAKYTPNVSKSDDNKSSKEIKSDVKKGLIDPQAYAAIYKFETTKGRIVKGSDGKYKATTMEVGDKKYDVHQKDNVIKNHIEKSIGLDTWYKIPPIFRMQIFSYMFNSDSYEDKKGDRFRWLAGLAQAVNPNKFSDRQSTMTNPSEAIEYIKGLDEKDFAKHYNDYLDVLHSQYASLSTPNGNAYDDAAKELSWFKRPIELEKYYGK